MLNGTLVILNMVRVKSWLEQIESGCQSKDYTTVKQAKDVLQTHIYTGVEEASKVDSER